MSEHAHPGAGTARGVGSVSSTPSTPSTPPTSSTSSTPSTSSTTPTSSTEPRTGVRSAWLGWLWFASVMLILLGVFNVIEGLVALFNRNYFVAGPQGLLVFNFTGWGWIHLIIGALAVVTGAALFTGAIWARIIAVVLVVINAIAQLAFLSAYPVWSTLVIVLDVVVIWAIVVHGEELRREESW